MNKKILIITIIILTAIIAGLLFFFANESEIQPYQKESLIIEQDLFPIELSQEEQQALQNEGLKIPSSEDAFAEDLQSVRSSDEFDAIEADLNETNLSELDAEIDAIEFDLSEL